MSEPFHFVVQFRLALSTPDDPKDQLHPTAHVFPNPAQLDHMTKPTIYAKAWSLIPPAVLSSHPQTKYTVVIPKGPPGDFHTTDDYSDHHPDYEEDGWRAFIEW